MDDADKMARAVEQEEARRAGRVEREGEPDVRSVDDRRILSGLAEVALTISGEAADLLAEQLDPFDFDVATRAVKLAHDPDEVVPLAERIAESDRLSALRVRANGGDEEARRELARAVEAMRRAVR